MQPPLTPATPYATSNALDLVLNKQAYLPKLPSLPTPPPSLSCFLTQQSLLVLLLVQVLEEQALQRCPAPDKLRRHAIKLLEVPAHALHVVANLSGQGR